MTTLSTEDDSIVDALADDFDLMSLSQEDRIQRAITAISRYAETGVKYSIRRAAIDYDVPRSTLQDRYNGRLTRVQAHGSQQKLSPAQENILVEWIKVQASLNCHLWLISIYSYILGTPRNPTISCCSNGPCCSHFWSRHRGKLDTQL